MRVIVAAAVAFGGINYLAKSVVITVAKKCKKCLSRTRDSKSVT